MASIFISYAHQDRERVAPLASALEEYGWSVWWDRRIPPGKTFDEVIEEQLDAADAVIGVWSEAGVKSSWVRTEAAEGSARGVLVPVLLETVRIPLAFRRIQAADLRDWAPGVEHEGFRNLISALEPLLADGSGATIPRIEPPAESPVAKERPRDVIAVEEPTTIEDPAHSALVRAQGLAASGDWEDVVAVLRVLEEEIPDLRETHPEAGHLLEDARRRLEAADLYDEAEVLYTEGRFEEAVERLDQIQQLDPDNRLAVELRSKASRHVEQRRQETLAHDYSRAQEAMRAREWSVAVARLERLLAEAPDHVDAQAELERARAGMEAEGGYRELHELARQERWNDVESGLASLALEHPGFGDPDDLRGQAEAGRDENAAKRPGYQSTTAAPVPAPTPAAVDDGGPKSAELVGGEAAPGQEPISKELIDASANETLTNQPAHATTSEEALRSGHDEVSEGGGGERKSPRPRWLIAVLSGGAIVVSAVAVALVVILGGGGDGDDGTESVEVPDGPIVTIGAQDFGESAILAELYGQAMEDAGYPVNIQELGGFRDLVYTAFDSDDINFTIEYAASTLEFLNGFAGEASSDVDETVDLLQQQLDERGLVAFEPAEAVDSNAFVVTEEIADELGLEDVSDLTEDLTLGGPPDCPENAACIPGLQSVYDIDLSDNFVPLDGGGPLTVAALQGGEIDVAILFSTSGVISDEGWVVLNDDEGLINADNIIPIGTQDLVDAYGDPFTELVDSISAALTTAGLTDLNRQVDIDLEDPDAVATAWLESE